MDVSAVKAKAAADTATGSKQKSTAEHLSGEFSAAVAERMKQSGQTVGAHSQTGLVDALTAKSDVQADDKTDQSTSKTSSYDDYQTHERADAPERDVDDYAPRADVKETVQREAPQQHDTRSNTDTNTNTNTNDNEGASSNQQTQSGDQDSGNGEDASQNTEATQTEGSGDTAATEEGAADQGDVTQTQDVLATVIDVVQQNGAVTGEAGSNQGATTEASKAQGVVTSQQANANANANMGANEGGDDLGDMDMTGENTAKKNTADTGQKQAQANLNPKGDNNHLNGQDASLKQQQAADIAAKVGQNQKLDINVTVTKQSEQLVSQPTANLGAQAAMTSDGDTLTQTASQAAAKGTTQGQQAAATHTLGNQTGQQGQEGQQQAQQNLQAAIAETAQNSASSDTKSQSAQSAANNAASSSVKVGGAEAAPNAQGLSQTNTTQQQAAPPQKATQNPQAQHRAQVNEQVNVQISKAIANGMDKISIQLKPAHLGRIDIQLEIASDGRVSAVVTADNKDTLDLLKQDSRELERAMREAGLQMDSGDLSFNLRENGNQDQGDNETAGSKLAPLTNEPTLDELLEANTAQPNIISDDRIDITA